MATFPSVPHNKPHQSSGHHLRHHSATIFVLYVCLAQVDPLGHAPGAFREDISVVVCLSGLPAATPTGFRGSPLPARSLVTTLVMVSIRRRKLLGLCSGKTSTSVQLSVCNENAAIAGSPNQNGKPDSVHPLPSFIFNEQKQVDISTAISTSLKEEAQDQQFPDAFVRTVMLEHSSSVGTGYDIFCLLKNVVPEVKRRKKYRRKLVEDQEPCTMRGVYFKNMKWQAAIKVDKKQIHLGTCGSQEEAAHLYDRAAFMCGREPNFDLSEEEKQELGRFKWEEFLAMTRNAITSKKHQRRLGSGHQRKAGTQLQSVWEPEKEMRASSVPDGTDGDLVSFL
ncbi:hypothetical protein Taro_028426 [Colocasia esculenta]|uniref:AP2/ERF domain-containing protein n=1 Tax=Colocasia esculenta TaxID=4460 RepID=A0A843VB90_COLES|nr:hypothetical protein [Colocasia esculenta]